jgi:hypothetical protein
VVPPAVLQFRKWLTIWADESAKLKDANVKKRYAAMLEDGLKPKLKKMKPELKKPYTWRHRRSKKMKPDWKVAVVKQLKDQGVDPASKTGRAATKRAERASRSVEKHAADNVRESERRKANKANRSVEQEAAYKVKEAERKKAAYWAKKNSQGRAQDAHMDDAAAAEAPAL